MARDEAAVRVVGRHDVALVTGLGIAVAVIFSEQLSVLFSSLRQIEASRGLQLLPALGLLTVVFTLHLIWKDHDKRVDAEAAAKVAGLLDARAVEVSTLAAFSAALAATQDLDAVRAAGAHHLPLLLPERGVWVVIRGRGRRDELARFGASAQSQGARHAPDTSEDASTAADHLPTDVCFPMVVGGVSAGALGVSSTVTLTENERRLASAAASLLALAVKNAELRSEVRENSVRDALTGCFTRAHTLEVLEIELRRARRTQMPLSILRMDLDNFASINERHGDLCGDAVLAAVGQRVKAALRGSDVKCRYGDESFLVILPDTPMGGALRVSETLAREVERDIVSWNDEHVQVSASFGVATVRAGEVDPAAALARANDSLMHAKQQRQGRVPEGQYVAVPA